MRKTYTRTLFIDDLPSAVVTIYDYHMPKYSGNISRSDADKTEFTGVTSWDIVSGGIEAKYVESKLDPDDLDENHEYLVLHFEDGSEVIYKNSNVSMFIDEEI